jgi:hypothetical protein
MKGAGRDRSGITKPTRGSVCLILLIEKFTFPMSQFAKSAINRPVDPSLGYLTNSRDPLRNNRGIS